MKADRFAIEKLRQLLQVAKDELKDPEMARTFLEEGTIFSAPSGKDADRTIEAIYRLSDSEVTESATKFYDLMLSQFQALKNFLH